MHSPPIAGQPHPVDWKLAKEILEPIDESRQERRAQAGDEPDAGADQKPRPGQGRVQRHREQRSGSEQGWAHGSCGCGSNGDRDEASRLPLEEEKFDRDEHRRDRRAKRRGHAAGRPGDEESLALRGGEVEELSEQ